MWRAEDTKRHHKRDLTNGEAAVWAETAGRALKEYGSEAAAVRIANAGVRKRRPVRKGH